MTKDVLLLLVLSILSATSSADYKLRTKRQGYGDLAADTFGDSSQPQAPQQQAPQPQAPQPQAPQQQAPQPQAPQPQAPQLQFSQPQAHAQSQLSNQQAIPSQTVYRQAQAPVGQPSSQNQYIQPAGPQRTFGQQSYATQGLGQPNYSGTRPQGDGQFQSGDYPGSSGDLNSLPGQPGTDYPIYGPNPPTTSFTCSSVPYVPGYYADTQSGCQAWHICEQGGKLSTFLCPNGTIFNQLYLTCDWWYNVNCGEATNYYNVNAQLYQVPPGGSHDQFKGSGYGRFGGTVVSGNAGAPNAGNFNRGGVPTFTSPSGSSSNMGNGGSGSSYRADGAVQNDGHFTLGPVSSSGQGAPSLPTAVGPSAY